ncbi:Homoaconitase [Colletotrichum gloeosporioides]|uniref:Homoaconitase, mitochondrial n=1 Tax=Colletotrichum gloeosporioides TaxID=474922 RepID=A0A8H4FJQ9_COLGL|nr:Homoaconitase [Colletotrichum gloeosporioides]KAF3804411.1 Homoaconitase [Colletotrichum gloeosporioides]
MLPVRRAVAFHAARTCRQFLPRHVAAPRPIRSSLYTTSARLRQNAFHSQLESHAAAGPSVIQNPQTMTEKIVQNYSVGLAPGKKVRTGDYVTLQPHKIMTHDNSWPVALKFMGLGATKLHDKDQVILTLDHDVQNKSDGNLKKYRLIEEFGKKHGTFFSGAGDGIGHQIMVENGFAWPGTVTVASDSHSNMYGGVGALGTALVRTDAAAVWATGKTWWQVPPIAKITLTGTLRPGTTGKDIIVALCGLFNKDEVLNHSVEFVGSEETMRSIPVDDRLTVANMTTEHGAAAGIFPMDSVLKAWMTAKATTNAMLNVEGPAKTNFTHERIEKLFENPVTADPGAVYAKELYLNLDTLCPFVAGPNSVKVATPLHDLEAQDIKVNKAYLVSCTNSRASDIAAAARVFREAAEKGSPAKVAPGVKFYLAAASRTEQAAAEASGDWEVLTDAGAQILPAGCGPCIGLGTGLLEPGEVGISASNRNFKGRMGSTDAKAYLASPEVVAASALQGKIAGPGWYQKPEGVDKVIIGEGVGDITADISSSIEDALEKLISQADDLIAESEKGFSGAPEGEAAAANGEETLTDVLPGFPEKIEGEIVFCDADNLNTDGIYPGKYTYQDDVTTEKMAEVCMENYDTEFRHIAKAGDVLVSSYNFGTGSSREQAATAILAKGIPMVIAGSFSNIFSRNSVNNALMALEVPKLVERLREAFKDEKEKVLTRRTGWKVLWDVKRSKVVVTEKDGASWSVKVGELPPNVQEIIAKGGLEKWVKSQI